MSEVIQSNFGAENINVTVLDRRIKFQITSDTEVKEYSDRDLRAASCQFLKKGKASFWSYMLQRGAKKSHTVAERNASTDIYTIGISFSDGKKLVFEEDNNIVSSAIKSWIAQQGAMNNLK